MNFKRILSLCLIITSIIGCSKPDYLLFDGSSGRLEDFNGKWLVINYWADWCPPCIKELPELSSFYEDNKDKVNVFTYNFDQLEGIIEPSKLFEFINDNNISVIFHLGAISATTYRNNNIPLLFSHWHY